MKVHLCGEHGCCPSVEKVDGEVLIGEGANTVRLTLEQWNSLVAKVKAGQLDAI